MAGDITPYLGLIPSENANQPNYVAFISIFLQGIADARAVVQSLPSIFDLDTAVGAQLDVCGLWIGALRILEEPINNPYFSWDTDGLGWDQANWYSPGDPLDIIVTLPDEQYRLLLKATAAANRWDGTLPSAQIIYNDLFDPLGVQVYIRDNQNMSMTLTLAGPVLDNITQTLFLGGYLGLVGEGVGASYIVILGYAPVNAYLALVGRAPVISYSHPPPAPMRLVGRVPTISILAPAASVLALAGKAPVRIP